MTAAEIDAAAAPMFRARMHVPEIARRLGVPPSEVAAAYRRRWENARRRTNGLQRKR